MSERTSQSPAQQFQGFEPLTANFLYCPNQFFDVCLSTCSLGTVRLVAFVLLRTLRWLDEEGTPIEQDVTFSYTDLVREAGISHGAVSPALKQAMARGFVECLQSGQRARAGQPAKPAQFALKWSPTDEYTTDPKAFDGFFAGRGFLSPIPISFFEHVARSERLAVIKVVGTILRHTIGYQNQFGGRRSTATLSYTRIQQYARISDRSTLSSGLEDAVTACYVHRKDAGCVHPSKEFRRPATYAVRWLEEANKPGCRPKTRPEEEDRAANQTSTTPETRPVEQATNQTNGKTQVKEPLKRQPTRPAVVHSDGYKLLREVGFGHNDAESLASRRTAPEIERQIHWLDARRPRKNRLGLLRRAIEDDWPAPNVTEQEQLATARSHQSRQLREQRVKEESASDQQRFLAAKRQALLQRWQALAPEERRAFHDAAITAATSTVQRRRISECSLDEPPFESLDAMARSLQA